MTNHCEGCTALFREGWCASYGKAIGVVQSRCISENGKLYPKTKHPIPAFFPHLVRAINAKDDYTLSHEALRQCVKAGLLTELEWKVDVARLFQLTQGMMGPDFTTVVAFVVGASSHRGA